MADHGSGHGAQEAKGHGDMSRREFLGTATMLKSIFGPKEFFGFLAGLGSFVAGIFPSSWKGEAGGGHKKSGGGDKGHGAH